jgi:hypothetical protein
VVEIDPVGVYAELGQALALGGEVLLVGGAARVADQGPNHDRQGNASPPLTEKVTVLGI